MKQYIFRGYDKVGNKGWVYGDLTHTKGLDNNRKDFLYDRVMVGGYEVDLASVSLCIGRKDKNGKDIFCGDIVKAYWQDKCVFEATVVWYEDKLSFMLDEGDRCFTGFARVGNDDITYEVINNIYEQEREDTRRL